jgi:hypothetical protein
MDNHTKYSDLHPCLRCTSCRMSPYPPVKAVSGDYGFFYTINCIDENVKCFKDDNGNVSRSFWYDPNTQDVWVDAGSLVNGGEEECGRFMAEFPSP